MMLLYLSSKDSPKSHKDNHVWDFIVSIPKPLKLSQDKWELALLEVKLEDSKKKIFNQDLYIYTDIVEHEAFVKDAFRPLLAIVDKNGKIEKVNYMTVATEFLDHVRVYIRDELMNTPTIHATAARCTLRLKRK